MSKINQATHTPGPWTSYGDQAPQRIVDARSRDVATVHCSLPVWEANARLIAAAPEMLSALQGIAKALEANPKLRDVLIYSEGTHGDRLYPFDAVSAAIAKATGGAL